MTRFRKLLLVTVGAAALCGLQACSSGTELNPQPLPPSDPTRGPDDQKGAGDSNGGSSGTSGATPGAADAGAEGGDGGDAGSDGGDR